MIPKVYDDMSNYCNITIYKIILNYLFKHNIITDKIHYLYNNNII